jgi:site-specific DNA-methyltransferase (adenine-specific)
VYKKYFIFVEIKIRVTMNKAICGNAMDLILDVADHSVDLTILDPNYQDWDILCQRGLICQAVRVTKLTGNIICFTKQPFDYELRNEVNHIFRREIIWSFSNGGAWVSKRMPLVSFQKIFWLTLSKDFYIDVRTGIDYNDSTKSMKRSTKVFGDYKAEGRQFNKSNDGTWIRDHYHFNKPHCGKIPAKPKELMRILVKCFSPEKGIVLDPFFGSGISGDVCTELNRNFIAFDIDRQLTEAFNNKKKSNQIT